LFRNDYSPQLQSNRYGPKREASRQPGVIFAAKSKQFMELSQKLKSPIDTKEAGH